MMRKYYKLLFTNLILPISIGTLIYLAFRPVHLTVFHWAETLGFYSLILKARTLFDIGYLIPEWVIYSLPNGLWSYSFMFFISFIWGGEDVLEKIYFVVLVVALSVGSELGQLLNFIPGIFCLTDVALYSFGLLAGYCSGQYYSKGEYV